VSYELFVGVRPFDANNLTELMNKIIKKHPAEPRKLVPDFPEKLQDIIAKMMKKNPKRRYNDASEIIDELNKVLEESPETGFFKRTITKIFYKDWN
jgi:serine/threonine-protein kinase